MSQSLAFLWPRHLTDCRFASAPTSPKPTGHPRRGRGTTGTGYTTTALVVPALARPLARLLAGLMQKPLVQVGRPFGSRLERARRTSHQHHVRCGEAQGCVQAAGRPAGRPYVKKRVRGSSCRPSPCSLTNLCWRSRAVIGLPAACPGALALHRTRVQVPAVMQCEPMPRVVVPDTTGMGGAGTPSSRQ